MDILLSKRLVLCLCALVLLSTNSAAETAFEPLRLGFASNLFTDVNENDAKASIKVWGQLVARVRNVPVKPTALIFKNHDELLRALQEKKVDAVGILTPDFERLRRKIHFTPIFAMHNGGTPFDQYILLAHRDGPLKTVADLRGRSLLYLSASRTCLAPLWLDTFLSQQGLPPAARYAGKISQDTSLSKAVLSVFFRQSDACVVTRRGFNTMSELNPQLAKQLIVLAESVELVPGVFVFRADYNPPFKEQLIESISDLKRTPPGQQILTIFHSEDMRILSPTNLDSALNLIENYRQLTRRKH